MKRGISLLVCLLLLFLSVPVVAFADEITQNLESRIIDDFDEPGAFIELARATEEEKASQLRRVRDFMKLHAQEGPKALERLQRVALEGGNIFAELMETVRVASLGQITQALYEVGGQYRRGM